jgi:hypothetical protein
MVEVDKQVVMTGVISLTVIFIALLIYGDDNQLIKSSIVGVIALAIGVVLPSPKIDNKRGVLKW